MACSYIISLLQIKLNVIYFYINMAHDVHHEHLLKEVLEMLKPLFNKSSQGIVLYLDDHHKTCNKKYAELLGYKSVGEFEKNEYPVDDIDPKDQEKAIKAFMKVSEKLEATTAGGTMKKQNGGKFKAQVIMIPLPYKNETFVLEFFSKA